MADAARTARRLPDMENDIVTKAVIFDVDGTLVDSVDVHAQAWVDAFRDFGHDVKFADVRGQIGKGGDQLLPVFLSEAEIADKGEALEKHRGEILHATYLSRITAFPEVRALFDRLLADGKQIALASSAKKDELGFYTQLAGIEGLAAVETSSADAERTKPHPDIFDAALSKLGPAIAASDAVVVGDTPYDAEAACKAGIRPIGVLCGGWTEEELRSAGCIAVYQDPADLLRNYDSSPLS